jgi:hypothetical protein
MCSREIIVRCDQLKNKSSRRVTYGNPCYSIGSKANSIYFLNDRSVYYIISDRNASLYTSENFDRRVRLRTSGTLLTSFLMAIRSHMMYDVLSYRCNYCKKSKK